jgi:hypothetical protein
MSAFALPVRETSGHGTRLIRRLSLRVRSLIRRAIPRPDGQITSCTARPPVQLPLKKYSGFPKEQITSYILAVPSHRGAARDRHERGAGCGGRVGAFDEQRWMRTAKSCGPDVSTLASSSRKQVFADDGDKKADRRGERDISRKTIARGMPGVSRCDLTNACA